MLAHPGRAAADRRPRHRTHRSSDRAAHEREPVCGERTEAAGHWWELTPSGKTVVHLDIAHRGLGTAVLGPDTRPQYRLTATEYVWQWRLTLSTETN